MLLFFAQLFLIMQFPNFQEASEDTKLCAIHAKRVTIMPKDIQLADVFVVNVPKYDVQIQMETFFQISSLLMCLSAFCTTPRILFFHLYIINHNSFHLFF